MISWRVYLLRCSDDSLYCGVTTDVDHWLQEHNQGAGARYTRSRLPVALVWSSGELTKSDAFKEEYRIKRLSKAMKEGIIDTGGNKKKALAKSAKADAKNIFHDRKFTTYGFTRFQVCRIWPDPSLVANSFGVVTPAGSKAKLNWSLPSNS